MISGRDIVFISSIEWDRLWQGHHELASRLAAMGNRVLYLENIGVRAPGLRDRDRVIARARAWAAGVARGGPRPVAPGLWVSAPVLTPPFGSRPARALNRALLVPAVARSVRRLGLRDPIVWTYLPTDTALELVRAVGAPGSLVVYNCLADFRAVVPDTAGLERSERALLARCDAVFAQPGLVEHCRRFAPATFAYEPGVSIEVFDPSAADPAGRLAQLPRPVIGYVGGLHRHVDFELLVGLARARPNWSWVFVGPAQEPVERLAALPNVHLVGAVAHNELAGLIAAFDVCTVPYVISAYTSTCTPTKLGEYLAMGKPVVSTPLPYALGLEEEGGVVVTAPPRPPDFLAAIERALALAGEPGTRAQARALAEARAWDRKLEAIAAALGLLAEPTQGAELERSEREQATSVAGAR